MGNVAINLPRDAYLHVGAPTEWWWHIGTLTAGDGRSFGFEINAAGFATAQGDLAAACFSEMMLSDPATNTHYKKTSTYDYDAGWAEWNTTLPWFARIGDRARSSDWVSMQSGGTDIDALHVEASFTDDPGGMPVSFDLRLRQQGPALFHWGTGEAKGVDPNGKTPLEQNNYYYSFTNLQAEGAVRIGEEVIPVTGVTWMDHQYGAFSAATRWVMHDAQLSNGVAISNSSVGDFLLVAPLPTKTYATILEVDGSSTLVYPTWAVPLEAWLKDGVTYYLKWIVDIPQRGILELEALMDDQLFPDSERSVYEGAAKLALFKGQFDGQPVTGTAWIEQALAPLRTGHARRLLGRGQRSAWTPPDAAA
jgi:predicted secreted hydrolase